VAGMAGHKHRRWRLSGKKHGVDHVRNDINVTPLVDVMLVLLIIFMLMVLLMGRGYEGLSLPKASNFSQEKDHMQPVVSLDVEGNLYYEKTRLGPINPSRRGADRAMSASPPRSSPDHNKASSSPISGRSGAGMSRP